MDRIPDLAIISDAMIAIREAQSDWERTQKAGAAFGIETKGIRYDQLIATAAVRAARVSQCSRTRRAACCNRRRRDIRCYMF